MGPIRILTSKYNWVTAAQVHQVVLMAVIHQRTANMACKVHFPHLFIYLFVLLFCQLAFI